MNKGDLDCDPRGLIYESYRIESITPSECRTIFLDWAVSMPAGMTPDGSIRRLLDTYGPDNPDHPMTEVLRQGLGPAGEQRGRRGGRAGRLGY